MPDLVDMIDAQASRSPTRDAVVQDNGSTTYRELNVLARRVFFNLHELRQPRALIYLAQSPEAYASMLGVLMAGGYYCPVNLAHPVERQKQVIQLFDPDIIVTNSANVRPLSACYLRSSMMALAQAWMHRSKASKIRCGLGGVS
jgi:non-ribosomal peptide synthetase component F